MRLFEIYSKWSVQTSIDKHMRALCSRASVGLTQARPNKQNLTIQNHE